MTRSSVGPSGITPHMLCKLGAAFSGNRLQKRWIVLAALSRIKITRAQNRLSRVSVISFRTSFVPEGSPCVQGSLHRRQQEASRCMKAKYCLSKISHETPRLSTRHAKVYAEEVSRMLKPHRATAPRRNCSHSTIIGMTSKNI